MASFPPASTALDSQPITTTTIDSVGIYSLSLGAVQFYTSECPERFPIAAVEQMLVKHQLPGGTRILSAFGPDAKPVTWSGRLFAANQFPRIRQLRLYAVTGQPVTLVWNNEAYIVIVKDFTPTYLGGYAEYEITVEIVSSENGSLTVASASTIDSQVQALQAQCDAANAATQAADPVGSQVFQGKYTAAKAAIQAANPIAQNIVSAALTVIPAVQAAVSAVNGYAKGLAPISGAFAAATQLSSTLTAISANVLRGQSATSTQVQGGSLFGLAAMHYGDVTQAFNLATANGLSSPFLSAAQQAYISLPPLLGH